jgi:hypothetical protein
MAEQLGENLPEFDDKKVYLVSGKTLNKLVKQTRMNRARVVEGGGLKIVEQNEHGTFLAVDWDAAPSTDQCPA